MLQSLPDITELPAGFEAIGVERNGVLAGGCLYSEYRPCPNGGNCQMWAVGHNWLSRTVIRVMFDYPFNKLNCHRVTACTAKNNKPARQLLEDLGFVPEGKVRFGYNTRQHLMVYGMLREECGWI